MAQIRKSQGKQTRSSQLARVSIQTCSATSLKYGYVVGQKGEKQNKKDFPSFTKHHLISENIGIIGESEYYVSMQSTPGLRARTMDAQASGENYE